MTRRPSTRTSTRWATPSSGASGGAAALTGTGGTGAETEWTTVCTVSTTTTGRRGTTTSTEGAGRITGTKTGTGTDPHVSVNHGTTRRRVGRRTGTAATTPRGLTGGTAAAAMIGQSTRVVVGRSIITTVRPR